MPSSKTKCLRPGIRDKLDCNDAFIDRWSKRFREERLAVLFSRHAGQEASTLTPGLEARILEWTLKRKAPDGSTQWSNPGGGARGGRPRQRRIRSGRRSV